jgi:hypothetical protein
MSELAKPGIIDRPIRLPVLRVASDGGVPSGWAGKELIKFNWLADFWVKS